MQIYRIMRPLRAASIYALRNFSLAVHTINKRKEAALFLIPYFCNIVTIIYLTNQKFIPPFFAALMMLVMAFSITPKRTVHELLGCHDKSVTPYQHHKGNETSINKDGFHCACEQQEFQTPFISSVPSAIASPFYDFAPQANVGLTIQFHSAFTSLPCLRGPPSISI